MEEVTALSNGQRTSGCEPLQAKYIQLLENLTAERKRNDDLEKTLRAVQERLQKIEEHVVFPVDSDSDTAEDDVGADTDAKTKTPAPDADDTPTEKPQNRSRVKWIEVVRGRYGEETEKEVEPWTDLTDKKTEASAEPLEDEDKYAMTWCRIKGNTGPKLQLAINSKSLRKALKEVIRGYTNVSFDTTDVLLDPPFIMIYHNQDRLYEHAKKIAQSDGTTAKDIEVMLEQIARHQDTVYKDIATLTGQGEITYALLWSLFYSGCHVVRRLPLGDYQVAIVAPSSFDSVRRSSDAYDFGERERASDEQFKLDLEFVDYKDGQFLMSKITVKFSIFVAAKKITDLPVYPLKYYTGQELDDPAKTTASVPSISVVDLLRAELIDRGRKFEAVCLGNAEESLKEYSGEALVEGDKENVSDDADVMSDSASNYSYSRSGEESTPKVKASSKAYVIVDADAYYKYCRSALEDIDSYRGKYTTPVNTLYGEPVYGCCACSTCSNQRKIAVGVLPKIPVDQRTKKAKKRPELTDEQRLICSPRVFGFMVREKKWAQFRVENIRDINDKAKNEAFNSLELDKETKKMLSNLVQQHSRNDKLINDLIPGKGNGLIVLLHGPPGVGKTLTAESLALQSGKPLYSVTMSDVGVTPETVEQNMKRVFELATRWKALLLFDEADIFLEKRSLADLSRNSLVSVLLRILEYFQGILFLTSNRVKTFDEAFQSRIHVAVQFQELRDNQRARIWKMWFDKYASEIEDADEIENELSNGDHAGVRLNGRQIRNVFSSAMAIARFERKGVKLNYSHIERVLKRTAAFQNYMLQNQQMAEKQGIR